MEKVLSQEEIDALVRPVRGGKAAEQAVSLFDYRRAGGVSREQLESISTLHEGFARNLTNTIGAYLRTDFQAGLVSAEYVSYREFLGALPEHSYLASMKLSPIGAHTVIQMDFAVAFPLIDVLLGGEGTGQVPSREITEIEEQILETIMRIICRELEGVWQPLGLEFQFEQRQQPGQVQHLLPVEEKTLGLSFEVSMKSCRGLLSVAVPAVVSNALLRKLSSSRPRSRAQLGSPESAKRLRQKLLGCRYNMELRLKFAAKSSELASLQPGKVIGFKRRADGIAELTVHDQTIFLARMARTNATRAALIVGPVEDQPSGKEGNGDER